MLPELDFRRIRPHGKSQHAGFEELCCQLAGLEVADRDGRFMRKGGSADAGLECFFARADGGETGWQAKYFDGFGTGQASNLSESLATAMAKHPALDRFVVCLPIDLRDERAAPASTTELKRFEDWRRARIAAAASDGRGLAIDLWGKTQLLERLARDDARHPGRAAYWFDEDLLSKSWFDRVFAKTRADLGPRYTPSSSVELPVRRTLAAMARDPSLAVAPERWAADIDDLRVPAVHRLDAVGIPAATLDEAARALAGVLSRPSAPTHEAVPTAAWRSAAEALAVAIGKSFDALFEASSDDEATRSAKRTVYALSERLHRLEVDLEGRTWAYVNVDRLLITGPAGAGKSHLLAEFVEAQLAAGRPAVLVPSNTLEAGDPWSQILARLDLSGMRVERFLGALDAAAQASGVRAIVAIDALNERAGFDLWTDRLDGFLADFDRHPNVSVVVSVRDSYLEAMGLDEAGGRFATIVHPGFGGDGADAAEAYLEARGIERLASPALDPSFMNPLFLKTCCDALVEQGSSSFPKGLHGISAVHGFYMDVATRAIGRRLRLAPFRRIPERALSAFAAACAARGSGHVPLGEADAIFESFHPSDGRAEGNLLLQVASEGILAIERVGRDAEGEVRFTFERFGDHAIAARLLDDHLLPDVTASFASGPLHETVFAADAFRRSGVVEALAVQLPERTGIELLDIPAPTTAPTGMLRRAHFESRLWRDPAVFTERTLNLLAPMRLHGRFEPWSTLVEIAAEPANAFNSEALDARLRRMEMSERDAVWSTGLAGQDAQRSPVGVLIRWAWSDRSAGAEPAVAGLAALALAWCLTTSDRTIRDRATKAIANLLSTRLHLAADLIRRFKTIDEPYLTERLSGATYGAALQGLDDEGLAELASAVWQVFFEDGTPPVHLATRDNATGILEYVAHRGLLPQHVDIHRARPPFASPWPLLPVADDEMARFVETSGQVVHDDAIAASTGRHGDFRRYVIERLIGAFSPHPIADAGRDPDEIGRAWIEKVRRGNPSAPGEAMARLQKAGRRLAKASKAHADALAADGIIIVIVGLLPDPDRDQPLEEAATWREKSEVETAADSARVAFEVAEDALLVLFDRPAAVVFRSCVRHLIDGSGPRRTPGNEGPISVDEAGRWICRRAHELGWTRDRFGEWEEDHGSRGRMRETGTERIGKKYQWIALNELLAMLSDRFALTGEDRQLLAYDGAWQLSARDLDPSLLLGSTRGDGWQDTTRTWWCQVDGALRSAPVPERLAWLDGTWDELASTETIAVTDPDGRRWLVLDAWYRWSGKARGNSRAKFERDLTWSIACLVVKRGDGARLGAALLDHDRWLPEWERSDGSHLGEHPWRGEPDDRAWLRLGALKLRPTTVGYSCEASGYDRSLDESVTVRLPAAWLVRALDLRFLGGKAAAYGRDGTTVFKDPSTHEAGPRAALVDADAFEAALARDGLEAVWLSKGERRVLGGHDGYGGARSISIVSRRVSGLWKKTERATGTEATAAQLAALR